MSNAVQNLQYSLFQQSAIVFSLKEYEILYQKVQLNFLLTLIAISYCVTLAHNRLLFCDDEDYTFFFSFA